MGGAVADAAGDGPITYGRGLGWRPLRLCGVGAAWQPLPTTNQPGIRSGYRRRALAGTAASARAEICADRPDLARPPARIGRLVPGSPHACSRPLEPRHREWSCARVSMAC